ncbi:MAG TPA: CHAD domain-containing protein [Xanthobacteraceae bacterium]|jgi:inorganic triphosphatase YgiF|nr:CHAD domain-containing protein [Xanthobacteraceae bacterium]
MGKEVELKFEVPPGGARHLASLPALRNGGPAQEKNLVSVYFDTPKRKLRKNGLSLRVRHIGDKRVQTIKANGDAGLFSRGEWEKSIRSDTPDLHAARHSPLGALSTKKLKHALKPVFETRVHRTVLPLDGGRSHIEVTLDRGQVRRGRQSAPINEVELELKRGKPADLFRVARDLTRRVPARLSVRSKADRGYDLVAHKPVAAAAEGEKIRLSPRLSTADALRAIASASLRQVAANEPAVSAHDPEGVHQMRVGLRRLRAAISLFGDLLDDPQTERVKRELKWLTNELGPARDLDVYVAGNIRPLRRELERKPRRLPAKRGLRDLEKELEARRSRAFDRARRAVASERYRALVLDTLRWLESGDWARRGGKPARARRKRSALAFAREEIGRRVRKAGKKAKRLADLDPRQRHKVRIAIKKLRYAGDFFESLFPRRKAAKRLRRFERRLENLQDRLGALNDIAVHQRLARDLAGEKNGRKRALTVGVVARREQSRIAPLRAAAIEAAEKFRHARPYWA